MVDELFEQSKSNAWQKYYELKIETDKKQILFEEATSKLMKALDIACEELDDRYYCHRGIRITCDDNNCRSCIKEYLLKESEKQ